MDSIAIVVSVFLDGEAMQWTNGSCWTRTLGNKSSGKSVMEVTTAYHMMPLNTSKENEWRDFVIPAKWANIHDRLKVPFSDFCLSGTQEASQHKQDLGERENTESPQTSGGNPSGVPSNDSPPTDHIEFVVRRHLEHVLSVCCIPLTYKPLGRRDPHPIKPLCQKDARPTEPHEDECPIAITCGDILGHRIYTSASL